MEPLTAYYEQLNDNQFNKSIESLMFSIIEEKKDTREFKEGDKYLVECNYVDFRRQILDNKLKKIVKKMKMEEDDLYIGMFKLTNMLKEIHEKNPNLINNRKLFRDLIDFQYL